LRVLFGFRWLAQQYLSAGEAESVLFARLQKLRDIAVHL